MKSHLEKFRQGPSHGLRMSRRASSKVRSHNGTTFQHNTPVITSPPPSVCRPRSGDSTWIRDAVFEIRADSHRSADTHLFRVNMPAFQRHGVDFYLKDESSHPTGSLKHRLARSLFMYGLVSNMIHEDTELFEASSGSTAVSEAYFARMLGLQFTAVMSKTVSEEKIRAIQFYGGKCHLVESASMASSEAERLASECGGYFFNQFRNAEKATDWRGNNNIAETIFTQMEKERSSEPAWIVVSAGTGGTSATIGRYLRYQNASTKLCVADPENSVFYNAWCTGDRTLTLKSGSLVEGIGRPRVEESFLPQLVDEMYKVPDVCTFAMMRKINSLLGRKVGGSTGTNCFAALQIMCNMVAKGERGSVVSLICDSGERYAHTYYCDDWMAAKGFNLDPHSERIDKIVNSARWYS
ncbi:hypothetical protein CEUSTIGMA_g6547.t1 [Chlamydomonas eustigma]|uniref:Tryptophan synthase beta chain-like PALP domain-containing protein n=1 Tax=Chlamydomonas eustigma TaxID=1157962 RepID=A0A250X7R7_9CHLO|nr:hypothetical protein CEUSTIGMA_g6547.t1 [Chlamydomonas eustigma]|eukprot:GAX79107.1 hypothetical protein CEUSTIGMA_g6547.t1 [Chlamydomonas eustigma]